MAVCDELFYSSEIGSDYEAYGSSCGNLTSPRNGNCAAWQSGPASGEPWDYGDDPDLDALWDGCSAGDMADCDELYFDTPIGSEYEAYGSTCGNRRAATQGGCS